MLPGFDKFAGTHLFTWVERGTVRFECLPKNETQCPRPGLEPGPLNPESSSPCQALVASYLGGNNPSHLMTLVLSD